MSPSNTERKKNHDGGEKQIENLVRVCANADIYVRVTRDRLKSCLMQLRRPCVCVDRGRYKRRDCRSSSEKFQIEKENNTTGP